VSPSKPLRDASNDADSLVRDYGVESSMRLDVFHAKLAAEQNIKSSGLWEKLSSEEQRLVDKMVPSETAFQYQLTDGCPDFGRQTFRFGVAGERAEHFDCFAERTLASVPGVRCGPIHIFPGYALNI
jgi:hypothetical protein